MIDGNIIMQNHKNCFGTRLSVLCMWLPVYQYTCLFVRVFYSGQWTLCLSAEGFFQNEVSELEAAHVMKMWCERWRPIWGVERFTLASWPATAQCIWAVSVNQWTIIFPFLWCQLSLLYPHSFLVVISETSHVQRTPPTSCHVTVGLVYAGVYQSRVPACTRMFWSP